MQEQFFPGYNFKTYNLSKYRVFPGDRRMMLTPAKKSEIPEDYQATLTLSEIVDDFLSGLSRVNSQIRVPNITLEGRSLYFVEQVELSNLLSASSNYYKSRYGVGNFDKAMGGLQRNEDGTFNLYICKTDSNGVTRNSGSILMTIVHEFGHTLGPRLSDPIFNELIPVTFENLYERCLIPEDRVINLEDQGITPEQQARVYLEQLLVDGITEEDILAHLTGEPFGESYPDDYLNIVLDYKEEPRELPFEL